MENFNKQKKQAILKSAQLFLKISKDLFEIVPGISKKALDLSDETLCLIEDNNVCNCNIPDNITLIGNTSDTSSVLESDIRKLVEKIRETLN